MLSRLSVNTSRKVLLNLNKCPQKTARCKISGLACYMINASLRSNHALNINKYSKVIGTFPVRHQSVVHAPTTNETTLDIPTEPPAPPIQETVKSTTDSITEKTVASGLPDLPDIPVPQTPEIVETIVQLHPNGEATLASVGLGGYSPVGIVQSSLEWLHITFDMPWWATITLSTLCVRSLLLPLMVMSQKHAINAANYSPQMQKLTQKINIAKQSGKEYEATLYSHELATFTKEKNLNPLKTILIAGCQVPIFISFFIGLKRMANTPVESLRTGGLSWFTDLTISDPYYVLPIIAAGTMYASIEMSIQSSSMGNTGMTKYFLRGMPLLIFPFMMNFPGAILWYWVSTNCISIVLRKFLEIKAIKEYCNIPSMKQFPKQSTGPKLGFTKTVKNSWKDLKRSRQLNDRSFTDSIQFNKAGTGPLKKTFKYDPTKTPPPTAAAILAKKR